MKSMHKMLAAGLAAVFLLVCASCQQAEEPPQESSREETSVAEESAKPESSQPESSQPESSQPESSQQSSKLKKQQSSETSPELYDWYVDSTYEALSDFNGLLSQNPDTVGWVSIPNSVVDYPVVQGPNDAYLVSQGQDPYYLCRDFYHNDILSGSIFLDYRSALDSKNLLLHGHHMMNGSMFATVIGYNSFSFYQMSPVVTFNSLYEKSKWKIIAVCKTNTLEWQGPYFDYLRGDFGSEYDFLNFIYQIRLRSIYNCPVTVNEYDTIITMSTCAYDMEDFRMFIVARKVREGEDSTVNVGRATINPNPLYPDAWYSYYGGVRPEVTSFQDALNKKKINWYDGAKKWSQKDDDELSKLLTKTKTDAVNTLKTAYDPQNYDSNHLGYIQSYVNAYEGFIGDATNTGRVYALRDMCLAVIHSVEAKPLTDAQKKTLDKTRSQAYTAINNAMQGKTYRDAQQQKVDRLLQSYVTKIKAANDQGTIHMLKDRVVYLLNDIPTDAQLTAIEKKKTQTQTSDPNTSKASNTSKAT